MKNYLTYSLSLLFLYGTAFSQAAVVTLPYSNDFSSSAADFVTSGNGSWSLNSGSYEFTTSFPSVRGVSVVEADGIGGSLPIDFSFTTTMSVSTSTASNDSWGLSLLGDDSTPTTYILTDWSANNVLRIINLGGNGTGNTVNTSLTTTTVTFAENTDYTLTAVGVYTGTDLVLSLSVSDGVNTETVIAPSFDTSAFYDGNAMGLTSRSGALGLAIGTTVDYDDVLIVPEPTGASMVIAGLLSLGYFRRRRKA